MKTKSHDTMRKILAVLMVISLITTASFTSSCMMIPALRQAARQLISEARNTKDTESDGGSDSSDGSGSTDTTDSPQGSDTAKDDSAALRDLDFKMFSDNVTSDTLSLYFAVKDPAALGLTVPDVSLGDVSKEKSDETYAKFKEYQDQLSGINYDNLTKQEQITYDVMEYDLKEALEYQNYYYYSSSFNSITGIQTELPLVLSEYSFNSKEDIDQYLLLLSDLKRYYGDLMNFEKERAAQGFGSSDANLQKVIDSCSSFLKDRENHFLISSFAERLDTVSGLTEAEKTDYIAQNQKVLDTYVFPAYQLLIDGFTGLKGKGVNDGGVCNLPDGKAYYELLLKSQTSSDASVSAVSKQIEQAISDEIDVILSAPKDESFQKAYDSYNFSKGTVQQNLDYCQTQITADFPSVMDHNVTLKEVPAALEDFFSPAAYLSCRIDDPTDNLILTNKASLADYPNLLETIAHEGYPGHMFESIYHAQNISSYYQRTASFIGYSEGWAEYAAGYILSHSDYDQTLVGYIEAENQIFNILLPSRIDIGVNYEGWSRQDVYDYLSGYNLDMRDFGDYCYDMAVEIPCYYMPYCVGHLDTSDIIANAADKLGSKVSLKEIHEAYLDIGPAPFPIIEKYMNNYIQTMQE